MHPPLLRLPPLLSLLLFSKVRAQDPTSPPPPPRPWLHTFSGCMIFQGSCERHPSSPSTGYFLDDFEDSSTNETRCLQRASEFHAWCGNHFTNRTVAVFLDTYGMEVFPPFGCAIFQRSCPTVSTTTKKDSYSGVFYDDHEGAFANETKCLHRAAEFRAWCHPKDSPEAVAALYAPSAISAVVTKQTLNDDDFEDSSTTSEIKRSPTLDLLERMHAAQAVNPDPVAVKALLEKQALEAAAAAAEKKRVAAEKKRNEDTEITFNTTLRAMWPVSRASSFARMAVPAALFELAGMYLDCRSPPMPPLDGVS